MQPPAPPDLLQVQFLSKGNRRAPGAQTGGAGSSSSSGPGPPKRGGPELGALPDSLLPRKLGQGQRSGVSRLDGLCLQLPLRPLYDLRPTILLSRPWFLLLRNEADDRGKHTFPASRCGTPSGRSRVGTVASVGAAPGSLSPRSCLPSTPAKCQQSEPELKGSIFGRPRKGAIVGCRSLGFHRSPATVSCRPPSLVLLSGRALLSRVRF